MSAPGVSIEATLPDVERLLVDFARLVAHGNPQEAMERLQRVVATKRGRRALALTEPGRAALSLVLSERRVVERSEQRRPTTSLRANARRSEHVEMPTIAAVPPALAPEVAERVAEILREYERVDELAAVGLRPTRTVLISGPPGVGKTITMQYIASAMGRPLMHIEPSDVIGSYLGESARSLVDAFDAARTAGAVLGLDEVDALAKRRDDTQDVGEFKRFVSTLLLELDRWDGAAPVIAASNHLELLDPALDRRFETHLKLDHPGELERTTIIGRRCKELGAEIREPVIGALVALSSGLTGAAITQRIEAGVRRIVVDGGDAEATLIRAIGGHSVAEPRARARIAVVARGLGMTYRQIGDLPGCSHTAARRLIEGAAATDEAAA
jgi:AAA+ superfamily predicted ATPase